VQPGHPVPPGAAEYCRPLLDQELKLFPKATTILTLGGEAFDSITPKKFHVLHDRRVSRHERDYWLRGCPYELAYRDRKWVVVPTFHPSFVARTGFTVSPVFERDVAKAGRFAAGLSSLVTPGYNYNPTDGDVIDYVKCILDRGEGGLDIETPESATEEDELNEGNFLPVQLIGLSAERNHALGVLPDRFDLLRPLFNTADRSLVYGSKVVPNPKLWAYNAGFDFHHLSPLYRLDGIQEADAMMLLHLLFPDLARKDLGTAMSLFTDLPFHKNLMDTDPYLYNAADTFGVLEAGQNMIAEAQAIDKVALQRFPWVHRGMEWLFWNHMMPIVHPLGEWNWRGMNYDVDKSMRSELQLRMTLEKYEEWWSKNIPLFSWSSPKQLIALFEAQGMKVPKRKRQKKDKNGNKSVVYTPSVDDEALNGFVASGNQVAHLVQEMRTLRKAGDFYGIASPDGRVYCWAKPHGQEGGRIQTVRVNMQQLPEQIAQLNPRDCIIPEDPNCDLVVSSDFSQIEFWIYAWYTKCKRALEIKASGDYLYGAFYEDIWNENFFNATGGRSKKNRAEDVPPWKLLVAKSWPLGFMYGRGVPNPADQGLPIDKNKAKTIHHNFHRDYPEFGRFHDELMLKATRYGYIETTFGRIRRFPNPTGQRNEILACPGQTTAVDVLIKNAILPLAKGLPQYFGERSHIYFTVHDSIITNINCAIDGVKSLRKAIDAFDYVNQCMETPIPEMDGYVIPAETKIGPSWGEGKGKEKLSALFATTTV
jgi:DNA polymerase I-like protein with 3'-5' exonuclease and polymerase domains